MKKFNDNDELEVFEVKDEDLYTASEDMEEAMFAAEEIPAPVDRFVNGTVVGGSLNLRKEPSTSAEILEVLRQGTIIAAKNPVSGAEWVEVETPAMEKGFVMAKHVKWDEE